MPWSPVFVSEIYDLVTQMKPGKVQGEDLIPPEVVKNNLGEGSLLTLLFSYIDITSLIPEDWRFAIIVPSERQQKLSC